MAQDVYAALLIDMELRYMGGIDRQRLVRNQLNVLEHCVNAKIPVVNVYRDHGQILPELGEALRRSRRFREFSKAGLSAFDDAALEEQLRFWGVNAVFLMGVNLSQCVKETARGASRRGFSVLTAGDVVEDNDGVSEPSFWYAHEPYRFVSSHEEAIAMMHPQPFVRPPWPRAFGLTNP